MVPEFDDGLLPPGVHPSDLSEFRERFAIFHRSDRRLRIYEQLERLIVEVTRTTIVRRIFVGGSFVTAEPEPNDFDCILVLDSAIVGTTLRPFEYNIVSRRMARRLFGGDVLAALEGSAAVDDYLAFFQTTRDGRQVGIVEIIQ